jgi:hypothetical protein
MIEACFGVVLELVLRVLCTPICDGLCGCIFRKDEIEKPIIKTEDFKKVSFTNKKFLVNEEKKTFH